MDIRDAIKAAAEDGIDTMTEADLGWHIAQELERRCGVIVDGDYVAEAIKQVQGGDTLTSGELADALAEIVEADQDDDGEDED